ncbi:MAG: hypothetical protein NT020_12630 [Chloroflexales bacterium]|nr:hypothetical protein [Chloroflexales bacterium]
MIRFFLLLALVVISSNSCGMSLPVTTTNTTTQSPVSDTPTNTTAPAIITTTAQTITTPTAQQPTVTVINELVATMRAMNMEQKICVGGQIGKERVPQIMQAKTTANATEVAVINRCATASMPLINGANNPAPANGQNAHTANQDSTWVTNSNDGVGWTDPIQLAPAASVPEIVTLADGSLLAMWVSFADNPTRFGEKLAAARLANGSDTWQQMGTVLISDSENFTMVDPDLVVLPDGRLRLYAYDIRTDATTHTILSAISTDNGNSFMMEPGVRFASEQMWDPNVVIDANGQYRMYYNGGDAIKSAVSPDGLTFVADPEVRWSKGGIPGAIIQDQTVWLYGCDKGLARRASSDGLTFGKTIQLVIKAPPDLFMCDPSVSINDQGWWMVFKGGKMTPPKTP